MASEQVDLIDFINQNEPTGQFSPYVYYGSDEDALTFYFRGDPDYARRLNSRVTVYLSLDANELVGCQIKSVRSVLEDLDWFDVSILHKGTKLTLIFWAFRGTISDDPDTRNMYKRILKAAQEYSGSELILDS